MKDVLDWIQKELAKTEDLMEEARNTRRSELEHGVSVAFYAGQQFGLRLARDRIIAENFKDERTRIPIL